MSKMNEVLGNIKGDGKVHETVTGKGSFSKSGFGNLVSAIANDTSFKIPTYDKDGKKNGEVNVSQMIREDLKKTLDKAKYPQKSEAAVLDTCDIITKGLAEAIPYIVTEQIKSGKKFEFPQNSNFGGSIYLADVPGGTKEHVVRDMKTQEKIGTSVITTKDSVAIKAKSPVPSFLKTKTRK